jgi:hypothetical protein
MREEIKEARTLRELLSTQRLSESERRTLEHRIAELEKPSSATPIPAEGVLGVFDRPKPRQGDVAPTAIESEAQRGPDVTSTEVDDSKPNEQETELSPEQVEDIAVRIVAIADRISWLRRFWATAFSVELASEAESWLARLQALAKNLPDEVAEAVLGSKSYLLKQNVRNIRKPAIDQRIQQRLLPPSAPALEAKGNWMDLYFAFRQPRVEPTPQTSPGYVADGQALVS